MKGTGYSEGNPLEARAVAFGTILRSSQHISERHVVSPAFRSTFIGTRERDNAIVDIAIRIPTTRTTP